VKIYTQPFFEWRHCSAIITAVTQNHGDGYKSHDTAKITVFTAIVNL